MSWESNRTARRRSQSNFVTLVVFIVACLPLVTIGLVRFYKSNVEFGVYCGGHLKRAADANTIELAATEMETAVKYLETHGMTNGFTSVLYFTPNEDVGFWYKNLSASLAELRKVNPEATQLEKSNVLMKLRETLLDGMVITMPRGISIFPHNRIFMILTLASFVLVVLGVAYVFRRCHQNLSLVEIMIVISILAIFASAALLR